MRLLVVAALAALACGAKKNADATPPRPQPRVVVEAASGARPAVDAELARTAAEQQRGLMHRESLGAEAGMLFVFDREQEHVFWMENTLIPLDMIFIDDEGRIVGLVERGTSNEPEVLVGDWYVKLSNAKCQFWLYVTFTVLLALVHPVFTVYSVFVCAT